MLLGIPSSEISEFEVQSSLRFPFGESKGLPFFSLSIATSLAIHLSECSSMHVPNRCSGESLYVEIGLREEDGA